jgi:Sigma-70, region 4
MSCAEGETLELIDVLLQKMSPTLRLTFTMTYFEEMSTAEASALLGVSMGTFKSRLFRTRQHLMIQAQRSSLVAPLRRVTHSAYSRSKTDFQALAAKTAQISPRRIAFSGLSRTHSSPVSGTPNAND